MRTVLVVEDETVIRMVACELLEDAGFDVVDFDNAADAMAFCRNLANDIAAVFTDINMPGDFDGLAVARLVENTHPTAVVVVTSGRYNLRPADLGPNVRFLPKPWTAAGLVEALSGTGVAEPHRRNPWHGPEPPDKDQIRDLAARALADPSTVTPWEIRTLALATMVAVRAEAGSPALPPEGIIPWACHSHLQIRRGSPRPPRAYFR